MKFDKIMLNDIQTTDSNSTAFKIGCLLACLGKKKEMVKKTSSAQTRIHKQNYIFISNSLCLAKVNEMDFAFDIVQLTKILNSLQVTGSHINIDKIKEIMYPKIDLKPEEITYINQILKSCANRGKY